MIEGFSNLMNLSLCQGAAGYEVDRWIAGSRLSSFISLYTLLYTVVPEVRSNCFTGMATKQEQELSLFELASAKLSDAQKLMAEARDLLRQDLNNARQEKSAIEEITKTLSEVHFASTIKLNVGGKIYKTTLDTLRKDPDSMLCAMFSGRFELKADEDDGAYFIDRDGELFR